MTLTRVPKQAFIRLFSRVPGMVLYRVFSEGSPLLDMIKKGNMLNVYIRRND